MFKQCIHEVRGWPPTTTPSTCHMAVLAAWARQTLSPRETPFDTNWWFVFSPLWIMIIFVCMINYQEFAEIQRSAAEKDPELFGLSDDGNNDEEIGNGIGIGVASNETTTNTVLGGNSNTNYGSVGRDGVATPEAAAAANFPKPALSEEEKEKLKEKVIKSGSTLCTQCCLQGFILILVLLIAGKLQGAEFSTVWIISPFLFAVSKLV